MKFYEHQNEKAQIKDHESTKVNGGKLTLSSYRKQKYPHRKKITKYNLVVHWLTKFIIINDKVISNLDRVRFDNIFRWKYKTRQIPKMNIEKNKKTTDRSR